MDYVACTATVTTACTPRARHSFREMVLRDTAKRPSLPLIPWTFSWPAWTPSSMTSRNRDPTPSTFPPLTTIGPDPLTNRHWNPPNPKPTFAATRMPMPNRAVVFPVLPDRRPIVPRIRTRAIVVRRAGNDGFHRRCFLPKVRP